MYRAYLEGVSDGWLFKAEFEGLEDGNGKGKAALLSWDVDPPHFGSASAGSMTWTDPSLIPRANWFGSDGCDAITAGYAVLLLLPKLGYKLTNRSLFIL